jgi:hypothetical protein
MDDSPEDDSGCGVSDWVWMIGEEAKAIFFELAGEYCSWEPEICEILLGHALLEVMGVSVAKRYAASESQTDGCVRKDRKEFR